MLRAWHAHFMAVDPDALAVYEVSSSATISSSLCRHIGVAAVLCLSVCA